MREQHTKQRGLTCSLPLKPASAAFRPTFDNYLLYPCAIWDHKHRRRKETESLKKKADGKGVLACNSKLPSIFLNGMMLHQDYKIDFNHKYLPGLF
jgi:hypothetical protein